MTLTPDEIQKEAERTLKLLREYGQDEESGVAIWSIQMEAIYNGHGAAGQYAVAHVIRSIINDALQTELGISLQLLEEATLDVQLRKKAYNALGESNGGIASMPTPLALD